MTLVKTGEGQDGLVEREVSLDGGAVLEEAFIKEGEGSAFVSRPNVLVAITASERGLPQLQQKVEQLIGRGFHNIALTLKGVERVDEDDWAAIKAALAYADQFAGWVPICGASPGLKQSLETIARKEKKEGLLSFFKDRADARAELKKRNADEGGGVDPLVVQSGDATTSTESSADDDWGGDWGGAPSAKKDDGLPKVDVAELLVEADELAGLRDKLHAAIKKGKKYFTLRLHFKRDRRMNEQDMHALVAARDAVARAQGQLVLAALQDDVLKWLRLLGEDRHFTIADTADDAEAMHRRHASGQAAAPAPAPAADGGAAFTVLSRDAKAIVVRPTAARGKAGVKVTTAPARVVTVTREGLPGLGALLKRWAGEGAKDVIVDLSTFKEIRGERFESLPTAAEVAKKAGVRLAFANVAREVRALLKILGVSDAPVSGAAPMSETLDGAALYLAATRPAFEELRLELTTERLSEPPPVDPVSSVELEPAPALAPTKKSGAFVTPRPTDDAALAGARQELAAAQAAADKAAAERDAARRRLAEVEAERDGLKRRAQELEASARRVPELEQARERAERKVEEQRAIMERAKQELETRQKRVSELELIVQTSDQELDEVKKELEGLRGGASQAQGAVAEREKRIAALERELAQAKGAAAKVTELERDLSQARSASGKASELMSALSEKDERIAELEQELERAREAAVTDAAASGGNGVGDPDLQRKVGELERENARILSEAQEEIQRLIKEQQLLREELESAGDMIERLGKELEYS